MTNCSRSASTRFPRCRSSGDRSRADPRQAVPVRGGHLPLPRAGPRPDHRRLVRDAQTAGVHRRTDKLLGVHMFGTGATELVHIGQAVMGCGGTVDYLVDAVFNYPTCRGLQGRRARRHEQDPRRPRFPRRSVLDPSGAGGAGHAKGLGLFSWFRKYSGRCGDSSECGTTLDTDIARTRTDEADLDTCPRGHRRRPVPPRFPEIRNFGLRKPKCPSRNDTPPESKMATAAAPGRRPRRRSPSRIAA